MRSILFSAAIVASSATAFNAVAQDAVPGNVIFFHPDGSALQQWNAARMYWYGADDNLNWDKLPWMAVYRGHMADRLTGTSNGGATTHAFGYKVIGPNSYGTDDGRDILSLSGYPGSISREAANNGHPTGLVNDGDIAGEPGTGAFFAETDTRGEPEFQSLQLLGGRPGFNGFDGNPQEDPDITDGEEDPVVILGGGERFFLPVGTPYCGTQAPTLDQPLLDCFVHFEAIGAAEDVRDGANAEDAIIDNGPTREDGRNLLQEAVEDGYVVIRTKQQYLALLDDLVARPRYAPKVLGVFAADDIFNDQPEERVRAAGLVRSELDGIPQDVEDFDDAQALAKIGDLVLWGTPEGTWGPAAHPSAFETPNSTQPPTVQELTRLAVLILDRRSRRDGKPFHLVVETESTDNMPNNTNAIGTLRALKRSDDTIGEYLTYLAGIGIYAPGRFQRFPTLMITAADSDGGGLQVLSLNRVEDVDANVGTVAANRTELPDEVELPNPLDGLGGREVFPPFQAEEDALSALRPLPDGEGDISDAIPSARLRFAISYPSSSDVAGGIISRAAGPNANLLQSEFSTRFDNTDVYRLQYATLFGVLLPDALGELAPSR
ncbi:MAG: alkaline phosphatase [Pseudomonadota bacterium]